MRFEIRLIEPEDNSALEALIRQVLIEFSANKPGFAWQDAALSQMFQAYQNEGSAYWVALTGEKLLAGAGVASLQPAISGVCELQKMYVSADARGQGIGQRLIETALGFARNYYQWCYLETLTTMKTAQSLYRKQGFIKLPKPLIETEHCGCDQWFLKEL